ncbi:MAG TPA: exodeoxyribonuclease VII large subunit, partial [Polyangiaceae bacterium]|nr:exodeoxyribonuclease VII large subunit [Polyangiaceae bacterium]
RARQQLSHLGAEMVLRRVHDALNRRAQRCDEMDLRMHNALARRLRAAGDRSFRIETRLLRHDPAVRLRDNARKLEALHGRLSSLAKTTVSVRATQIDRAGSKLQALSPVRVLERGYALVYGPDGGLLRASTEVQQGEQITARLHQGSLSATVTGKK